MFELVPKPSEFQGFYSFGTHSVVCCPTRSADAICFESDPECPNYVADPQYAAYEEEYSPDTDYYYGDPAAGSGMVEQGQSRKECTKPFY